VDNKSDGLEVDPQTKGESGNHTSDRRFIPIKPTHHHPLAFVVLICMECRYHPQLGQGWSKNAVQHHGHLQRLIDGSVSAQ
jgi:hypothetical protein